MDKKTYILAALLLVLSLLGVGQAWFILSTTKNLQQQTHVNQVKLVQLQHTLENQSAYWRTAEANYLISLADLRLRTQHDVSTASYLLQKAQQILQDATEPKLKASAQLLSASLAELNQLKPAPIATINQQLIHLQQQIPQLTLAVAPNLLPDEAPLTTQTTAGWRAFFAQLTLKLKKLITLRHNDTLILPLISRNMRTLNEQHLLSLLIQTQLATWQAQNSIYQENLNQIQWLIEHYYCLDDMQTKNFLTMVVELRKMNVAPLLPDLSRLFIKE